MKFLISLGGGSEAYLRYVFLCEFNKFLFSRGGVGGRDPPQNPRMPYVIVKESNQYISTDFVKSLLYKWYTWNFLSNHL